MMKTENQNEICILWQKVYILSYTVYIFLWKKKFISFTELTSEYVYFLSMYVHVLANALLFTKLPPKYVHHISFKVYMFSVFTTFIGFHIIQIIYIDVGSGSSENQPYMRTNLPDKKSITFLLKRCYFWKN